MGLKNLTDGEMIDVSAAWLDPARTRPALEKHPLTAALLPSLEEAHTGLVADDAPPADDDRAKERARLYQQGVGLDQRHDRKGRGVFNLLTALADLTDDPDDAAGYLATRDAVFPEKNLTILAASWRSEAGNARRVHDNVLADRGHAAALRAIPLPGKGTLLDAARAFARAGLDLGVVEDQRVALEQPAATPSDARSGRVSARNRWITVANTLVRLVDEVLQLQGAARHAILGSVTAVEARADARALARRPSEPDAPDDPAPPDDNPPTT